MVIQENVCYAKGYLARTSPSNPYIWFIVALSWLPAKRMNAVYYKWFQENQKKTTVDSSSFSYCSYTFDSLYYNEPKLPLDM